MKLRQGIAGGVIAPVRLLALAALIVLSFNCSNDPGPTVPGPADRLDSDRADDREEDRRATEAPARLASIFRCPSPRVRLAFSFH